MLKQDHYLINFKVIIKKLTMSYVPIEYQYKNIYVISVFG